MKPRELLHECEADARAFMRSGARVLHAMEPLEDARQLGFRDAAAGIAHRKLHAIAEPSQRDGDFTVEGELERVGQEIEDDLLPHVPVHVHGLGQRRAVEDEPQAGFLDRRSEHAGELGGRRGEVGRLVGRVDASGLDAREVEQRVHQLQQPQAVAVRDVQ